MFWQLEQIFWNSEDVAQLVASQGLEVDAQLLFGEIMLCVLGLKPMVLCENLPQPYSAAFNNTVVKPFIREFSLLDVGPGYTVPISRFTSFASEQLHCTDCLVVCNPSHPTFAIIEERLRLSEEPANSPQQALTEADLASMLAYPVSLDDCAADDLIEVGT
jgi:hypothetical protein